MNEVNLDFVDRYVALWNEPDAEVRRRTIEDLWAPDGTNFTPSIEALYVPNIDDALDEESAKREFWTAFRVLGQWWADLPPY